MRPSLVVQGCSSVARACKGSMLLKHCQPRNLSACSCCVFLGLKVLPDEAGKAVLFWRFPLTPLVIKRPESSIVRVL